VGALAWLNETSGDADAPGTRWRETDPDPFGLADPDALTRDGPARTVVGGVLGPVVAADHGLEVIEGARARHCRTFVDGTTALSAFLPLRWLVSGSPTALPTELGAWRGDLDWWVFGDDQLGRAAIEVSGLRSDAWAAPPAIEGTLRADLDVTDRTVPVDVTGPAGSQPAAPSAVPAESPTPAGTPSSDALESAAP
jgi:hypothetical protein